ncbi:MAG TPA: sugar phosphate nucleotidyltransferase [Pirellulales bacterium]|jgi:glucose-1-phosphate cytidylyltransferase|nr:sugar phosphate nucleotidyltransferase [Pirellulales bacterium]
MKVVLFCGGLGMRLREYSEAIPKPMVHIGYRPILWHVMKYYAHFGHKDFVLCLGWKADVIKNYFLKYDECLSNDFVLSSGGKSVDLLNRDIHDWTITFCDTGTTTSIGQRLLAVERHLDGEETFLANYTDGLTDFPLPELIDFFRDRQAAAAFLCVRPNHSFHTVHVGEDGLVEQIEAIGSAEVWMNGGYFVFDRGIFDYLRGGHDLVTEPFQALMAQQRLHALKYEGFWSCMDTYKEKSHLDELYANGKAPWELWKRPTEDAPMMDLEAAARGFPLRLPK